MSRRLFLIVFMYCFFPIESYADNDEVCAFYKRVLPGLGKSVCGGGPRQVKSAGANSTFSESFKLNAARLPSEPSPYGLETIVSSIRSESPQWGTSFGLVKGFKKFGTGLSTGGGNTFYSNDLVQRIYGHSEITTFYPGEYPKGYLTSFSFGTGFPLNPSAKGKVYAVKAGLAVRYNKLTNTVGPAVGLSGGNALLTYGLGASYEKVSSRFPAVYFASAMMGIQLLLFEFEYTVLKNYGSVILPPVHIFTLTTSISKLMFTVAVRRTSYLLDGWVLQKHLAIQINATNKLSIGYLYNYIPGANSLAVQIFL